MVAPDRAQVFPVAVEQVRVDLLRLQAPREHLLAEVGGERAGGEQPQQHLGAEQVDAHVGEVVPAVRLDPAAPDPLGGDVVRLPLVHRLRLLDEPGHPAGVGHAQQAEPGRVLLLHRDGGDGHVRLLLDVRLVQVAEVHPVELVAGQDEDVLGVLALDVGNVLADRVGRALVPVGGLVRLLGGEHLDEPAVEHVELVRVADVPVEAGREELGEDVDAGEPAVEAVADRDVDEPVFTGDRDGRLGPLAGEREQPTAPAAAEDEGEDGAHGERASMWENGRAAPTGMLTPCPNRG